ncbi:uncharacterized protein [Nicotiana sylvestris]|uniref:uncharacterized protein n=1 Tax=Nicotiana sylvestris TaxID=4096 RepID=UPI00388C4E95
MVQSGGPQPQCYAFPARPEVDSSDAVILGIVLVCSRDASILFDPGFIYSYVSSYFASYLVVPRDSLIAPVYVSTPMGDFIIVDRVYHWLSPYHAILGCHAKTLTLAFPGLPRLEWRGIPGHSTSGIISYMKSQRMVEKGCLAYLAYVSDSSAEVPSMDSILVVREFLEVFPADLPGMPPDRDIDFCIDLVPGTRPIFIPTYRMALPELKELKE